VANFVEEKELNYGDTQDPTKNGKKGVSCLRLSRLGTKGWLTVCIRAREGSDAGHPEELLLKYMEGAMDRRVLA